VSDDELPAEIEPPISEDLKQQGIDFLQGLLASDKVDLDRFQDALDALLGAHTQAEFASVVRGLPPPVELTPPARRRREPLEINTSMGEVRLDGRWQVSRLTKISTRMGAVTIDLSLAEFDDWDVEIVIHAHMGGNHPHRASRLRGSTSGQMRPDRYGPRAVNSGLPRRTAHRHLRHGHDPGDASDREAAPPEMAPATR